jgi:hypothetical protein
MEKPHRFLLDRFSSYAEEGGAFLRRRRLRSRPFARIGSADGAIVTLDPEAEEGARLAAVAGAVLELGRAPEDA